jgi:hypothetical protein
MHKQGAFITIITIINQGSGSNLFRLLQLVQTISFLIMHLIFLPQDDTTTHVLVIRATPRHIFKKVFLNFPSNETGIMSYETRLRERKVMADRRTE